TDYTFPEEWYRELPDSQGYETLKELGYLDWRTVPQEKLIELVKTEPQWKNEIRWARNELRKRGYLDVSAPRGIWRLTAEGVAVAADPQAHIALSEREQEIATPKAKKPRAQPSTESPGPTQGTSQREQLVAKLLALAKKPFQKSGGLVEELKLFAGLPAQA